MAQSNPDKIEMMDERGYPREIKAKINELIAEVNRDFVVNFDTDSLNPIAKVRDTTADGTKPARRTVTLPRAPAIKQGNSQNPYVMGTNSSVTDPLSPKDDIWDITDPPIVDGIQTNGVLIGHPTDTTAGFIRVAAIAPQVIPSIPLTIVQLFVFQRIPRFDSNGSLVFVSIEIQVAGGTYGGFSYVTSP